MLVIKLSSCPTNPAYSCVFQPQNAKLFKMSQFVTLPLGLRMLPRLESSGLYLGVVDDVSILNSAHWTLSTPCIRFYLTQYIKEITSPLTYQQSYLELISDYPSYPKISQMAPKMDDGVAVAAVSSRNYKKLYACRLPGDSSIYTAELRAILLA